MYYCQAIKLNHAPALRTLCKLSETDPKATLLFIWIYRDEQWSEHNETKAISYLEKAASLNDMQAAHELAELYARGQQNTPKDAQKAIRYYLQMAGLGHPEGLSQARTLVRNHNIAELYYELAQYYDNKKADVCAALPLYARATDLKHPKAQARLADLIAKDKTYAVWVARHYENGAHGYQSIPWRSIICSRQLLRKTQTLLMHLRPMPIKATPMGNTSSVRTIFIRKDKSIRRLNGVCVQQHNNTVMQGAI